MLRDYIKPTLIALAVGLIAIAFGLIAAIVPSGVSARLFVLLFLGFSFLFFWGFRAKSNSPRFALHLTALTLVITLSVIWPRYIYLHLSGLPSVNALTILTMACLYLAIASILSSPSFSESISKTFGTYTLLPKLIALALVWRLFCCIVGETPALSVTSFLKELVYINSFILFGYIFATLENGGLILFRVLALCGIFVGLAGIYEAIAERNLFSKFASVGADGDISGTLANIAAEKVRAGAYREIGRAHV